ncbi:hypothetical protein [Comamonas sp. JC664]|uniref:hypothetical protein n=1 Tax=Comamonas sp. JC664 TaxID=2801917 RepID=UPI00174E77A7|nr:hypothetical protein [Comamonas sp. JC664]MBL0697749.1 hypothetical protein [Comamonas sp. JC664]GHG69347.1 hypothetical protein GCM10012319_13420 [Comamonas sp. KCTC 72670]
MKRTVALLAVLVSFAAGAYVLPGSSIIRRMAAERAEQRLSTLRVEGSLSFGGASVKEAGSALGTSTDRPEVQGDGVLSIRAPGRCRFEASVADGSSPSAVVQSGGRRKAQGTEIPAMSVLVAQVCPLLATGSGNVQEVKESVLRHLQSLGVETGRTGLARLGGEVTYVLGEMAEGRPQFWVYKDSFRPARLRYTDASGTAWDVRFLDYNSPATGELMPRTIEVWRGGQRNLRFTALKGDSRANVPDSLFTL